MEDIEIYGNPVISSLLGSFVAWALGLVVLIGGFILVSRLLIGKRIEQAQRELHALEEAEAAAKKAAEGGGGASGEKGEDKRER